MKIKTQFLLAALALSACVGGGDAPGRAEHGVRPYPNNV